MSRALLVGLALCVVAPQIAASSNRSKLETVDWANRDYGPGLRLKDGRFVARRYPNRPMQKKLGCRHTTREARLVATHHGDLTGNRRPEAVVQIATMNDNCRTARADTVAVVFAYRRGKVVEIGRGTLPPRLSSLGIAGRRLQLVHTTGGRRCSETWKLRKDTLERISRRCI